MVDLLDYNKLSEIEFFILECIRDNPQRIGEIARQHKTKLPEALYKPLKKLELLGMIKNIKKPNQRIVQITKKGKDNYDYKQMLKGVTW